MKGSIYMISSPFTDKIYVGSTTKLVEDRFSAHINKYNRYCKGLDKYVSSFDILDYDEYGVECLEEFDGFTKSQMLSLERQYILDNRAICVNRALPGRTKEQWESDNFAKRKIQKHSWYINKKKITPP